MQVSSAVVGFLGKKVSRAAHAAVARWIRGPTLCTDTDGRLRDLPINESELFDLAV